MIRPPGSPGDHRPGDLLTSIPGDFNGNGLVNEPDINLFFVQMRSANPDLSYDLTRDGKVDTDDRDELILKIFGTTYGDANLDMVFDTRISSKSSREASTKTAIPTECQLGGWRLGRKRRFWHRGLCDRLHSRRL